MSCSDEAGSVIEKSFREGTYLLYKNYRDMIEELEACKKLNAEEEEYLRNTKISCERLDKTAPEYLERWKKEKDLGE